MHINHADREHPGSSLEMFRKHSEHTELKRQQQRSLAGYCSNPYVRDHANCDTAYVNVAGAEKMQDFALKHLSSKGIKEQQNVRAPRHMKNVRNLLADVLQRFGECLHSVGVHEPQVVLILLLRYRVGPELNPLVVPANQQTNQPHTHSRI